MSSQQWTLPPLPQILDNTPAPLDKGRVKAQARLIEKTLAEFGLAAQVRNIYTGPRLTEFALKPDPDVTISKVTQLEKDLAVALAGNLVEIKEPHPGYPFLGVVVNHHHRPQVRLAQVIQTEAFDRKEGALKIGLGLDRFGQPVIIDLAALPHLLVGGTTGSGKSTCLNGIVASLLCTHTPTMLQFLLVDLTRVELGRYNGLPHLIAPVVTQPTQTLDTLTTIDANIDRRYKTFAQNRVRDIAGYNRLAGQSGRQPLPYLVIAIDNAFDLLINTPVAVEQVLARLAQRARGAGVHLVLSTARARTDTMSGTIKANFPARIAFRVVDGSESRLILDATGAETLLGDGEMLYKAPNTNLLQRLQGVQVLESELGRLVQFWQNS